MKTLKVDCVAEIDSFIGEAVAIVKAYDDGDIEIEYVTNDYDSVLMPDQISDRLHAEILETAYEMLEA